MSELTNRGMEPAEASKHAKVGAQAVMTGMVDVKDIIPDEAKPEKPGTMQEKIDALTKLYGPE